MRTLTFHGDVKNELASIVVFWFQALQSGGSILLAKTRAAKLNEP